MKKLLNLLLASLMCLTLLSACGGAPAPAPSQPAVPPAETPSQDATAYEDTYPGMWKKVCEAFTAETGAEVELILDKNLEDVIGPSIQGGDYPDLIHLATGCEKKLTEQFIKDKNIADITDYPEALKGVDAKVCSTYYTTRKGNGWARKNPDEVRQCYIMISFHTASGGPLSIPLMRGISGELLEANTRDDIKRCPGMGRIPSCVLARSVIKWGADAGAEREEERPFLPGSDRRGLDAGKMWRIK